MLRAKKAIRRCEAGKWHDQMCILRSLWYEDQIGGEWCRVTMSRWGKRQQSSRQEVAWADGGDQDVELWWIWGLLWGVRVCRHLWWKICSRRWQKFVDSGLQKQMNVHAICKNMKPRSGIVWKEGNTEEHYDIDLELLRFNPLSHPRCTFYQRQVSSEIPNKGRCPLTRQDPMNAL